MNEIHAHLTNCAAEAARVTRGISPEQLAGPSGCTGWTVRELANHLVLYTSHGLEHRAMRTQLPDELVARDFAADADWPERYAAQLDRALAAWAKPEAWDGDVDFGGGSTMPAGEIAAMLVAELALHGWDLARATGQDFTLPEDTGVYLLGVVERYAEMYRTYEGFAAPTSVEPHASAFTRALATSGRTP
ncbi:TIGR03086 family metal-binding protein [Streptomyces sp. NBC_00250]|uniref:TIGR03086 family metal-binding protein n=1 Tax=Streptomyces sp. NBC_00250 TaxID=2903641 RepID=UPI002E2CA113|nr:TIGR03086 family metal-binding protein [Streptomyces sp. NBC_00250]